MYHLSSLHPLRCLGDPEIDFEIIMLEVEVFIKQRKLDAALKAVNAHLRRLKEASGAGEPSSLRSVLLRVLTLAADVAQRLRFLVLKSQIFAAGCQPAKGFSIALRAASTADKLRLLPTLLEAVAALAKILLDLGEFAASRELLEAALPKVRLFLCVTMKGNVSLIRNADD